MTDSDFVRHWMSGKSPRWMAEQANTSRVAIFQRAGHLRSQGVRLPYRDGAAKRPHVEVEALNRLVEELRPRP